MRICFLPLSKQFNQLPTTGHRLTSVVWSNGIYFPFQFNSRRRSAWPPPRNFLPLHLSAVRGFSSLSFVPRGEGRERRRRNGGNVWTGNLPMWTTVVRYFRDHCEITPLFCHSSVEIVTLHVRVGFEWKSVYLLHYWLDYFFEITWNSPSEYMGLPPCLQAVHPGIADETNATRSAIRDIFDNVLSHEHCRGIDN